jgi:hypothetical protein
LLEVTVDNLAQVVVADQQVDVRRAKWLATLSFHLPNPAAGAPVIHSGDKWRHLLDVSAAHPRLRRIDRNASVTAESARGPRRFSSRHKRGYDRRHTSCL